MVFNPTWNFVGSQGNDTLITTTGFNNILDGRGGNDILLGHFGTQTLKGGEGNDYIAGLGGQDFMYGEGGNDEFGVGGDEIVDGEIIDGGSGINQVSSWRADLSKATITNVQTLGVHLDWVKLTAAQLSAFTKLETYDGPATLIAAGAGKYNIEAKDHWGVFNLTGSDGNDELIGNVDGQTILGGAGNDYIGGLGGADTLLGGEGDDEFGIGGGDAPAGEIIDGGAGSNRISSWGDVDLSQASISNVQTLGLHGGSVTLTAAQLAGFSSIVQYDANARIKIIGATPGTYDATGKIQNGVFDLVGSSGDDTLISHSVFQTIDAGGGDDLIIANAVARTIDGGSGNNVLRSMSGFPSKDYSQSIIRNIQTLEVAGSIGLSTGQIAGISHFVSIADGATIGNDVIDLTGKTVANQLKFRGRNIIGSDDDDVLVDSGSNIGLSFNGRGGNDTIFVNGDYYNPPAGNIDGGAGYNTLSTASNISNLTIQNMQALDWYNTVYLTGSQLEQFTALIGSGDIVAVSAGTIDISNKTTTHAIDLRGSTGDDTVIGDDYGQYLYGESGNDIIYGNGGADHISAGGKYSSYLAGFDVLHGGEGDDDLHNDGSACEMYGEEGDDVLYVSGENAFLPGLSGAILDGGSGNNTLVANLNISQATIANVQTLKIDSVAIMLTAAQLALFSKIDTTLAGAAPNVFGATAGTYDFSNKTITGEFDFYGSDGNDIIRGRNSADTLYGGEGDDEFNITGNEAPEDETIDGGAGINTLSTWDADVSAATISNVQKLNVNQSWVKLTGIQLDKINTLTAIGSGPKTIMAAESALYQYYDLSVTTVVGVFNITGSSGDEMLTGNVAAQTLIGGGGNDYLTGKGGADTMLGGDGNDTFNVTGSEAPAGEYIDGNADSNVINVWGPFTDLSQAVIVNVQTLMMYGSSVMLTAEQFTNFTSIYGFEPVKYVVAATSGTYDLSTRNAADTVNLSVGAGLSVGDVTFIGNGSHQNLIGGTGNDSLYGLSGNDNLYGGEGNDHLEGGAYNDSLYGEAGNDDLTGGIGGDFMDGGTGNDTYHFAGGDGADEIRDSDATPGNHDVLALGAGIMHDNLWFSRSGGDLLIQVVGTSHSVKIDNWYGGAANQIEEITASDGYSLANTQVQNLVNVMATFGVPSGTVFPGEYRAELDPVIAANWT
ncbi:MAG: calcium-binding protein [Alphaproteobacteria bacterium]